MGRDGVHEGLPRAAGTAAPPGDLREAERGQGRERRCDRQDSERDEVKNRQDEHDGRHAESAEKPAGDEQREHERRPHRQGEEDAEEGGEVVGIGIALGSGPRERR